jgi:hypothetical protein
MVREERFDFLAQLVIPGTSSFEKAASFSLVLL